MKMHKNTTVTVRLDASEEFRFTTRTGLISVQSLKFSPSDFQHKPYTAWCQGTAIKKDGTRALHDRNDYIPFADIPFDVLELALSGLNKSADISHKEWVEATNGHPAL